MLKWHHLNNKKKEFDTNLHVYIQNGSTYVIQLILYYGWHSNAFLKLILT